MKKENSLELVGNKITHQRTTNATNIHKTKHCLSLKKLFSFFNWLAVLLMWGCAASVYIDPSIYGKYFSVIGLTFPIWAAAVLFMTVITLLFQPKMVWIPLVGFVGCYGSIRDYCPINLSSPPPKRAWKVMSYNTMSFGNWIHSIATMTPTAYKDKTGEPIDHVTDPDKQLAHKALGDYGPLGVKVSNDDFLQ